MSEELDTLLTQPLLETPDNGFSNRVSMLLEIERLRRSRIRTEISMGLVVLVVLTVPFTFVGRDVSAVSAGTGITALGIVLALAIVFQDSLFGMFGKGTN